ncbi:GNAT family protein [soil metagenome]
MTVSTERATLPPTELIVDDELSLVRVAPLDGPALYELVDENREFLAQTLYFPRFFTPDKASQECFRGYNAMVAGDGLNYWTVINGEKVGNVQLFPVGIDQPRSWAMSYWLAESAVGKSVASRATKAAAGYSFKQRRLMDIQLSIRHDNVASQRVALSLGAQIIESGSTGFDYDNWVVLPR